VNTDTQLEDGADDTNPVDEDLEVILSTVRSLTNPCTSTEQQVPFDPFCLKPDVLLLECEIYGMREFMWRTFLPRT